MYWFLHYLLWPVSKVYAPVKVIGKKNYDKKQNYIVVCNHRSALDPVIMNYKFAKRIRFIAKKELWKGKKKSYLFNTILGCIPIDREKGLSLSITKQVFDILNNNEWLGIFPEGTRKDSEEDIQIKNGACLFAIKSKKPLIPCYIANKQKPFKRNVLLIGKPFELSEFYDQKLDKECLNKAGEVLENNINSLKDEYKLMQESKKKKNKNKVK